MATQTWNFDLAHSNIGFTIKHMMFAKVRGSFGDWEGSLSFDPADPTSSKVEATIKVGSIDTGNTQRDDHLRSADFFDISAYQDMTFASTSWEKVGENTYTVVGDLTIRDTTNPVTLTVENTGTGMDPWGQKRAGFTIAGKLNRKDFGLGWNQALETGGVLVGEEVTIDIEVQAVLAQAEETEAAE